MKYPKIFGSRHRVGVIGILNSGKTVFITSLINHVMHHDPAILRLRDGATKIVFDRELGPENAFEKFPYSAYRAEAHKFWPDKTERPSQYQCAVYRTDWHWTRGELSLVDIPGERVSDLLMVDKDYAGWSDWLLEFMSRDREHSYRDLCREYREFLASLGQGGDGPASAEDTARRVVERYSGLLARLALGYRPIVTPSAFVLSPGGVHLGENISKNDFSRCHPGLDARRAFAPLPADFRAKNPEIAKAFAGHYESYREEIAKPLWKMFSSCNELVFLVDIVTLLNANTDMYNGNRELVERIIDILSPGDSFFGVAMRSLWSALSLGHSGISGIQRLAFVATKADLVRREDRPRLEGLLRQMTRGFIDRLQMTRAALACEHLACSAVLSTESLADGRIRGGGPRNGFVLVDMEPPCVPESWPHSWKQGDYRFLGVAPKFPENTSVPPGHIRMDALVDFLLDPIS